MRRLLVDVAAFESVRTEVALEPRERELTVTAPPERSRVGALV
jgi:hypothetical protein